MYENTHVWNTFWTTPQFYGTFTQGLKMSANVSKCIQMSQNVPKCMQMYQNVCKCLKIYVNVSKWVSSPRVSATILHIYTFQVDPSPLSVPNLWLPGVSDILAGSTGEHWEYLKRREHWWDGFLPQLSMTFPIRSFAMKAPSDSEGRRACYHNYNCAPQLPLY